MHIDDSKIFIPLQEKTLFPDERHRKINKVMVIIEDEVILMITMASYELATIKAICVLLYNNFYPEQVMRNEIYS